MLRSTRWVLLTVLVVGCQPDRVAVPQEPEEQIEALRVLKRAMVLELSANEAIALNRGSNEESIRKLQRQFEGLRVYERIPLASSATTQSLTLQLLASGPPARVAIERIALSERPTQRRALPETTLGAFDWKPEDLRTVTSVSFRVTTLSAAGLLRWYAQLPENLPRLLYVRAVKEMPGGFDVSGEVYAFIEPERIPKHVVVVPALAARMDDVGLRLETVGAKTTATLSECARLQARLESRLPEVHAALEPLTRSHLQSARWKIFERLVRRVSKQSMNRLLGRPDAPKKGAGQHGHH